MPTRHQRKAQVQNEIDLQTALARKPFLSRLEETPDVAEWVITGAAFNGTREQKLIILEAINNLKWVTLGAPVSKEPGERFNALVKELRGKHIACALADLAPGLRLMAVETIFSNGVGHGFYAWARRSPDADETVVAVLTQFWHLNYTDLLAHSETQPQPTQTTPEQEPQP